jgi:adenine phosphoribosyltransferase
MEHQLELSEALSFIRDIPDFPSSGILFRDITPLLGHADAFSAVTHALSNSDFEYTHVVGIEARGFILGAAMAQLQSVGFVPLRKAGKLPHTTIARSYGLEYGSDVIEAHTDALTARDRVLLVDDVLATGGTLLAGLELIHELGAQVSEVVVLFEIQGLGGRARIEEKFPNVKIRSLVKS